MSDTGYMCYSTALNLVKTGHMLRRTAWGQNEFIFLVPGSTFNVSRPPLLGIFKEGTQIKYRPHIDKRNADGTIGVWIPSNEDQLSEDWTCVPQVD